jgi:ribonuclease E
MVQEESMKENTAAVHVQVPVEVTSFLLNEKRTEITKIELKQRVTVLLVPNKHLETPNYKLERLRHDDPRLEGLQASYTMIEEPDDEVGITRRARRRPRQAQAEPVIKGVLPDQPAPPAPPRPAPPAPVAGWAPRLWWPAPAAAAAVAGGGFFGWVKKLFGGAERRRGRRSPWWWPWPASRGPPRCRPTSATAAVVNAGSGGERGGAVADGGDRGERGGRDRNGVASAVKTAANRGPRAEASTSGRQPRRPRARGTCAARRGPR